MTRRYAWDAVYGDGASGITELSLSAGAREKGGVVGHALRSQVSQEAVWLPDEKGARAMNRELPPQWELRVGTNPEVERFESGPFSHPNTGKAEG